MDDSYRYRRMYCLFWRDEKVVQLEMLDKGVAAYCFTGPQSNRIGLFSFSLALANEDCGKEGETFDERYRNLGETFRERFDRVVLHMGWGWDPKSRVLYIPTWWRWNQPENANNLIGNMKDLAEVPKNVFTEQFRCNVQFLRADLRETFLKRYGNVGYTVPKGSPTQEQDQEQVKVDDDVDVCAGDDAKTNVPETLGQTFRKGSKIDWQAVLPLAAEIHHAGLKCSTDSDRSLLFKVAVLATYQPGFDREWVHDAVRIATGRKIKKPFGKFYSELQMKCSDQGASFERLLRDVPEPPPPEKLQATE